MRTFAFRFLFKLLKNANFFTEIESAKMFFRKVTIHTSRKKQVKLKVDLENSQQFLDIFLVN